jgi:hypothetical protein
MKITLLIPFQHNGSTWDNNELRYMLRSLEDRGVDFEYDIKLYADKAPDWLKNVNVDIVDRYYPEFVFNSYGRIKKYYENFFDTLNKLKRASNDDEVSEDFIYAYDDIILLRKLTLDIVNTPVAHHEELPEYYGERSRSKWGRTINEAIIRAMSFKECVYLYETHIPRMFNKAKLREMFKMFSFDKLLVPYAPSTLYFNLYYDNPVVMSEHNDIKAGFYGNDFGLTGSYDAGTLLKIEDAIKGKVWINYRDSGLNQPSPSGGKKGMLKKWIVDNFTKKSRYEK